MSDRRGRLKSLRHDSFVYFSARNVVARIEGIPVAPDIGFKPCGKIPDAVGRPESIKQRIHLPCGRPGHVLEGNSGGVPGED